MDVGQKPQVYLTQALLIISNKVATKKYVTQAGTIVEQAHWQSVMLVLDRCHTRGHTASVVPDVCMQASDKQDCYHIYTALWWVHLPFELVVTG